jgi:hypothetical protein
MTVNKKVLIAYHFYQLNETYVENFQHFLLFGYDARYQYYVLISGECTVQLPQVENIKYIFVENKNNDYGGYCHLIKEVIDIDDYEYFIFINSSIRGPFLPPFIKDSWVDLFIDKLTEGVGLVGPTIHILSPKNEYSRIYQAEYGGIPPYSHVQSTAYAMNQSTLKILVNSGFYDENRVLSKTEVILKYEIQLSQLVKKNSLNINSFLPEYSEINYLQAHDDINPTSSDGDPSMQSCYFGRTLHPYEAVFIKTNRSLHPNPYLIRLAYSQLKSINNSEKFLLNDPAIRSYIQKLYYVAQSNEVLSDVAYANEADQLQELKIRYSQLIRERDELIMYAGQLEAEGKKQSAYWSSLISAYQNSTSWKMTAPLRNLLDKLKGK